MEPVRLAGNSDAASLHAVVPAQAGTQVCWPAPITSADDPANELGFPPSRGRPRAPLAHATGFTLIEILVVVVIIGIALTLAVAQLMPDDHQTARRDVDRVALAFAAARDAAVLGGNATAVSINGGRIMHWRRSDMQSEPWRADTAANDADTALLSSEVTSLALAAVPAAPDERVVFLPEGIGAPFELRLAYRGLNGAVRGDALGNVSMEFAP